MTENGVTTVEPDVPTAAERGGSGPHDARTAVYRRSRGALTALCLSCGLTLVVAIVGASSRREWTQLGDYTRLGLEFLARFAFLYAPLFAWALLLGCALVLASRRAGSSARVRPGRVWLSLFALAPVAVVILEWLAWGNPLQSDSDGPPTLVWLAPIVLSVVLSVQAMRVLLAPDQAGPHPPALRQLVITAVVETVLFVVANSLVTLLLMYAIAWEVSEHD